MLLRYVFPHRAVEPSEGGRLGAVLPAFKCRLHGKAHNLKPIEVFDVLFCILMGCTQEVRRT